MRVSVIDLGTNTFNLLVVETAQQGKDYKVLYNNKLPVKLGKSGMDKKEIRPDAISRGLTAIEKHLQTISQYQSDRTYAFATSAIRSARNGEQFVNMVKQRFGLDVEVINGDREAELVYYGVKQAVTLDQNYVLIMDIGGGSIEFVIANHETIFWKKSYALGVARLLEKFKPSDPITIEEIEFISNYLEEKLNDLFEEVRKYPINVLVGASGSFDTLAAMIKAAETGTEPEKNSLAPEMLQIDLEDFENLYQKLINSTTKERKQMKGLEAMRIEMIVVATLLVKFILQKCRLKHLIQSNYSLKEGVIYLLLNQQN
jgi:exopolyphosphatase / guanosine-5'-triphosphate,3'-diphosphate pyrophosphatase